MHSPEASHFDRLSQIGHVRTCKKPLGGICRNGLLSQRPGETKTRFVRHQLAEHQCSQRQPTVCNARHDPALFNASLRLFFNVWFIATIFVNFADCLQHPKQVTRPRIDPFVDSSSSDNRVCSQRYPASNLPSCRCSKVTK